MFDRSFALQHLHDGDRIQASYFAQVARLFQQAHVVVGVKTIPALGAVRVHQAQVFPSPDRGGSNSHGARHVADFEIDLTVARHDPRICLLVAPRATKLFRLTEGRGTNNLARL